MAKTDKKKGKPWSPSEMKQLKDLAKGSTPTRVIVAIEKDGDPWLIEARADKEVASLDVQGKREAAQRWSNHVSASEEVGARWHSSWLASRTSPQPRATGRP